MLKASKSFLLLSAILFTGVLFLSSCATHYKIKYFNNIPDSIRNEPIAMEHTTFVDPLIQPRDVLQISVQTIDNKGGGADIFSAASGSGGGSGTGGSGAASAPAPGYVVDDNGYIDVPLVGKIKLQGLTTTQAKELIREKASQYYKDPIVNVRCTNFSITILGEVAKPGRYVLDNEKVSILDAIGMAGDLSITGERDNILLVREDNGNKLFVRLDITTSDVFKSPYYYLQKGDVLIVEPNKSKVVSSNAYVRDRNVGLGFSILSVLLSIATLVITLAR